MPMECTLVQEEHNQYISRSWGYYMRDMSISCSFSAQPFQFFNTEDESAYSVG